MSVDVKREREAGERVKAVLPSLHGNCWKLGNRVLREDDYLEMLFPDGEWVTGQLFFSVLGQSCPPFIRFDFHGLSLAKLIETEGDRLRWPAPTNLEGGAS